MVDKVYFPAEYILLQEEMIEHHQDLLKEVEGMPLEDALSHLAAKFNILADGIYDLADVSKVLLIELQKRRTSLILPANFSKQETKH